MIFYRLYLFFSHLNLVWSFVAIWSVCIVYCVRSCIIFVSIQSSKMVLPLEKRVNLIVLKSLGYSNSHIGRSVGCSRGTVINIWNRWSEHQLISPNPNLVRKKKITNEKLQVFNEIISLKLQFSIAMLFIVCSMLQ